MPEVFTKMITVIEPECDINQRLSLANIMRHAQQMGSDHLAVRGIDYNQMSNDGMVFVVSKMFITINRSPGFGERLKLTTIPKQPRGAQFIRDTFFETEAGEKLIEVSISWLLVDPMTHKILRPAVFMKYGIEMFPNDGEYITGYKLARPAREGVLHLRQVKYSDLDYNRHVNNAIYSNIVCDLVPPETMLHDEITSFGIFFRKEATFAQVLELEVIPCENEAGYYVCGGVSGEPCFEAEIKFKEIANRP